MRINDFILIAFAIISSIIIISGTINYLKNPPESNGSICTKECNKFNYTFYRLEDTSTYGRVSTNCWCLDLEKNPKDLGRIG